MKQSELIQLLAHYKKLEIPIGCSTAELRVARNKKLGELIAPAINQENSHEVWAMIDQEIQQIQKAYYNLLEYQKSGKSADFFSEVINKLTILELSLDATVNDLRQSRNRLLAALKPNHYPNHWTDEDAANEDKAIHKIQGAYCFLLKHRKKIQEEFNLLLNKS